MTERVSAGRHASEPQVPRLFAGLVGALLLGLCLLGIGCTDQVASESDSTKIGLTSPASTNTPAPNHTPNKMPNVTPSVSAAPPSSGKPLSVVVVVLDAARADHFGVYGYQRDTTPRIDAFAAQATRYATVISEAPFTFLAAGSLFTAGSPAVTGLVGRTGGRIPESLHLITESARDAGFRTLAYSENPYVTPYFGLHQGFDHFDEAFPVSDHVEGKELNPEVNSEQRVSALMDKALDDPSQPFFVYAHLLRPHNPYAPPAPFAGRFGSDPKRARQGNTQALIRMNRKGVPFAPARLAQIKALYDENLAYADHLFGTVLDRLEAAGRTEDTIVVLTSDHGEAFGEQGRLLHSSQLFDPMLHVPLVVRIPGVPARVDGRPVQLADLGAGLRAQFEAGEALGSASELVADGLVRLGQERFPDEPLYSWTNAHNHLVSARTMRRKLVIDAATREVVAYHDLIEDPGEQTSIPLDPEGQRMLPQLVAKVDEWVGNPVQIVAPAELDGERARQLEALGYLVSENAIESRPSPDRTRSD